MARAKGEAAQAVYRDREKRRVHQRESDLKAVMSTAEGRRFVWYLLDDICQLHGGSYTGNSQTFFNEGRRSVGIQVMQELQRIVPERYLDMVGEQVRRVKERAQDDEAADAVTTAEEKDEGIDHG